MSIVRSTVRSLLAASSRMATGSKSPSRSRGMSFSFTELGAQRSMTLGDGKLKGGDARRALCAARGVLHGARVSRTLATCSRAAATRRNAQRRSQLSKNVRVVLFPFCSPSSRRRRSSGRGPQLTNTMFSSGQRGGKGWQAETPTRRSFKSSLRRKHFKMQWPRFRIPPRTSYTSRRARGRGGGEAATGIGPARYRQLQPNYS